MEARKLQHSHATLILPVCDGCSTTLSKHSYHSYITTCRAATKSSADLQQATPVLAPHHCQLELRNNGNAARADLKERVQGLVVSSPMRPGTQIAQQSNLQVSYAILRAPDCHRACASQTYKDSKLRRYTAFSAPNAPPTAPACVQFRQAAAGLAPGGRTCRPAQTCTRGCARSARRQARRGAAAGPGS